MKTFTLGHWAGKKHIHAINMKLYAEDAFKTETPWDKWEFRPPGENRWFPCTSNPTWEVSVSYMRRVV